MNAREEGLIDHNSIGNSDLAGDCAIAADADWLAILRLLEKRSTANPVGEFFPPSSEAISLQASLNLTFPANAVERIDIRHSDTATAAKAVVTTPLLGLSGALAALPYHYTAALAAAKGNSAPRHFFDIFNHRAQSLFYCALRKHRVVLDKERSFSGDTVDRYSNMLAALCGDKQSHCRSDAALTQFTQPRDTYGSFAGLFANKVRSARNLEQLLRCYFRLDIGIEQFSGRWIDVSVAERCRLGATHVRLGENAMLGHRCWQMAAFFGVIVRRPDAIQLAQLAAGQPLRLALWHMIRAFAGDQYDFHIDVVTDGSVQRQARLNAPSSNANATRLGWVGVLGSMSPAQTATIRISHPTAARMQR